MGLVRLFVTKAFRWLSSCSMIASYDLKWRYIMKTLLTALLALVLLLSGCGDLSLQSVSTKVDTRSEHDIKIVLPTDRYPETMAHIASAIASGASAICTIDRNGADANRDASLRGVPTKKGFDRDEWPMAMCKEGGEGADIAYVSPKDNRGAGSWIGNKLTDLADGTRVLFVINDSEITDTEVIPAVSAEPAPTTVPTQAPVATASPKPTEEIVYYANCSAAREAGAAPLHVGDPGYSIKLDRDRDGIACS